MLNYHDFNIKVKTIKSRIRYIHHIKHVKNHMFTLALLNSHDYATIKKSVFNTNLNIYININSKVLIINRSLISSSLIIKCFLLIIKDVCDMQIADHYINVKVLLNNN